MARNRERLTRRGDPEPEDETYDSEELERRLRIDEHALDQALLDQPDAFLAVAKELAMAISRRDAAKQTLAEEEAEADGRARHDAEVAGEKTTEKQIANAVLMDRRVQQARAVFAKSNLEVGLLSALKEAFGQRGYILKDMVQLHVTGYFGTGLDSAPSKEARAGAARQSMAEARREREGRR